MKKLSRIKHSSTNFVENEKEKTKNKTKVSTKNGFRHRNVKHSLRPRSPANNTTTTDQQNLNQLNLDHQLNFDHQLTDSSIFSNRHHLYQQVNIILSVFLIVLSTLGIICSLFVIGCWIHKKIKRKDQKLDHQKILEKQEYEQSLFLNPNNTLNTTLKHHNFTTDLFLYQQKCPISNTIIPLGCIIIYASCIMLILSNLDCKICKVMTIWCLTVGFNLIYGKLVYDSFLLRDFLRNRDILRSVSHFNQKPQEINNDNNRRANHNFLTCKNEVSYGMANVANSPFRSLITSPVTKLKTPASSGSSIAPQATSSGDESDDTALKLLNTPNKV